MTGSSDWNRSFRRSANRWWLTFLGGVFVLVCLASATAPGPSSGRPPEETITLPARIAYGVAGVLLTLMLVRWVRSGIFTSRRGVTFRNVLATTFLAWEEVDHFERPARYGTWRKPGLRAIKQDGTLVASSIYQAGTLNRASFADDIVAELEELRLRAGVATPWSPDPLPKSWPVTTGRPSPQPLAAAPGATSDAEPSSVSPKGPPPPVPSDVRPE